MSDFPGAGTVSDDPGPVWIAPYRALAGFQADAVVREESHDELVITDHPVEQGALITDHAYKLPAQISLVYGWSEASERSGGDPQFLRTMYDSLLALQTNRTLCEIFTGKRHYQNMLLQGLSQETDNQTEHILLVRVRAREVIIADTQVVTLKQDPANMKDAQSNLGPGNRGAQQLVPPEKTDFGNVMAIQNFLNSEGLNLVVPP